MIKPSVFLAVPHYDTLSAEAFAGLAFPGECCRTTVLKGGSLLALVFNQLWATALNDRAGLGLTHFAMHHSDIGSPAGWLDVLVAELERTGADVLSTVVPIKDWRGVTSTGLIDTATGLVRRLTMREVLDLPETFDANDAGAKAGEALAVNTGLWVCRFTEPWVEEFRFTILDRIDRGPDGKFYAAALSEDWWFSWFCQRKGLKVLATRKVPVAHHGRALYRNDFAWGAWDTDLGDAALLPKPGAAKGVA